MRAANRRWRSKRPRSRTLANIRARSWNSARRERTRPRATSISEVRKKRLERLKFRILSMERHRQITKFDFGHQNTNTRSPPNWKAKNASKTTKLCSTSPPKMKTPRSPGWRTASPLCPTEKGLADVLRFTPLASWTYTVNKTFLQRFLNRFNYFTVRNSLSARQNSAHCKHTAHWVSVLSI